MGQPIGYHVTCRLVDSRVIAPTAEARRRAAGCMSAMGRGHRLLSFNVPDTHLHMEHGENRAVSGRLLQRVQTSIRRRLGIPVACAPANHEPIRNQQHLFNAFKYVLEQQPRHGLTWDPFHEASNLPDLLGLRIPAQYTANHVRELLPRVNRDFLLQLLGVRDLEPADGPLEQLVPAALAACGLTRIGRRSPQARAIRRVVLELADPDVSQARLGRLLGVSRQTVHSLKSERVDRRLLHAVRLQLGLRRKLAVPAGPFET